MRDRPVPAIPGVRHAFVQAGEIRMHVAEAGDPDAPPVVLLHGWPQNHYAWRRVIPLLSDRFRVIAPDLRGFGWSDAPRSSYLKQELATDVLALMDAMDLDRVHLAGHDWGGYITFRLALRAPERFERITAVGITHPWAPRKLAPQDLPVYVYQPMIATPFLGGLLQRYTPFVRAIFEISGGDRIWSAEERRVFTTQFREPDRAEAASRVYRSFLTRELKERPPRERLTVPARLLVGRGDPAIKEKLTAGYEGHADAMTVEMVQGGHWLPEEHPEVVADRIGSV